MTLGMKHVLAVAFLVVAPSIPRPSGACSPAPQDGGSHALDPAFSTDTAAPGAVDATFDIYRASNSGGGGCSHDSCGGGFNEVALQLTAADDRTPGERMGYRFTIVGGQTPPYLNFPTGDRLVGYGEVNWRYDSSFDGKFSFDVEIRAVDLNGNVGPATVVTITD